MCNFSGFKGKSAWKKALEKKIIASSTKKTYGIVKTDFKFSLNLKCNSAKVKIDTFVMVMHEW